MWDLFGGVEKTARRTSISYAHIEERVVPLYRYTGHGEDCNVMTFLLGGIAALMIDKVKTQALVGFVACAFVRAK